LLGCVRTSRFYLQASEWLKISAQLGYLYFEAKHAVFFSSFPVQLFSAVLKLFTVEEMDRNAVSTYDSSSYTYTAAYKGNNHVQVLAQIINKYLD